MKYQKRLYSLFSGLFILAYLWVFLGGPIHQLAHLQKEQVCNDEENSCHLKVVHSDFVNGCEHDFHFTKYQLSCEICALFQSAFDSDHFNQDITVAVLNTNTDLSDFYLENTRDRIVCFDSRGPPLNS